MIPMLRLGQLNRPGQVVSVYRTFFAPRQTYPRHTHDFPEIFYIESGRGTQSIAGRLQPLRAGDVGFVAPDAGHEVAAGSDSAMVIVNMAFSGRFLDTLRPLVVARDWPFKPGQAPIHALQPALREFMMRWIERLSLAGADRTDLAAFLLDLVARLRRWSEVPADTPAWLTEAVRSLDDPAALAAGVPGFAARCPCGQRQLGRTVRRIFGCSTIQLINRRRMAWFARELQLTRRSILDLAEACGLPNLSHCYRLFQAAYGCSPRRYRQRFDGRAVGGP